MQKYPNREMVIYQEEFDSFFDPESTPVYKTKKQVDW
jgi:hypothetical protein